MATETIIKTDVLVIGGGIAGCFAAIKAREDGATVTLVDKGYVGRSGQTPFAGTFSVFNPEWGHDLDEWMAHINKMGEYVNNRTWTEIGFKDSYARLEDLISWGVDIPRDEDGEITRNPPRFGPCQAIHLGWRDFATVLRKQTSKSGADIMDRIMITDLIKQEQEVIGAIGIPMDSEDLLIFNAKATIICAGAGGFKPPGWPISELTSDGDAMAYHAGAEITGKEFVDPHNTSSEFPAHFGHIMKNGRPIFGKLTNAEGDEVKSIGTLFLNLEFEAHGGRAPLTLDAPDIKLTRIGGGSSGMSVHKSEGIWPADTNCSTSIPGLFAAGDALGTMQSGSVYAAIGMALSGSAVTGARAGWGASEYASKNELASIDKTKIAELKASIFTPMERKGGFSPRWVTQLLQNTMIPYFIMYIKKEDRMQAALTLIEFMRDHLVPKLTAKDIHELRLAHETKNMILNAEMRLRAGIFRTESRGCHYREDYTKRDDPDWLAWVLLKEEEGCMKVSKVPVPKEWWPDLTIPYEERYVPKFPE